MPLRTAPRASLLLLFSLGACASGNSLERAPEQAEALNTWVERVHVEAERARETIGDSFDKLSKLAAGRFDKEPAAVMFAKFVQSVDLAEQQAKRFREVVGPMVTAAQPVFEQRQQQLSGIASERMRARGEMRFSVAKERYDAIATVAVPAQDQFDQYVKSLRDHAAFLAHDLNAGAIDDIQDEVKLVARTARELDRSMDSCRAAARAYVEQSSMPAAPGR
jgi:tetrahydromethanopterin S-methyltransferase subunit F